MKRNLALGVVISSATVLLVIGYIFVTTNKSHADQQSVNTQQNVFSNNSYTYCVPKGNTGPTWSYPDGIHAVENPPDPTVVNGQQQLQSVINKMQAQEGVISKDSPQNITRDENILSGYRRQYDSLVSQYDDCSIH